jgi:AraC family transcriptional regulator
MVWFTPDDAIQKHEKSWNGVHVTTIQAKRLSPLEYGQVSARHVLLVAERGVREAGETSISGLPKSSLRDYSGRLVFIPAGHEYYGWQKPRELLRSIAISFDPKSPLLSSDLKFDSTDFHPRLFFLDDMLWMAAMALKAQIEHPSGEPDSYGEALATVIAHRLLQTQRSQSGQELGTNRGLSPRDKATLIDYINAGLHESLSLNSMAETVKLSPFHFSRLFKQSFGEPPHRYLTQKRIERAKQLLANSEQSVAEIAYSVGFGESSSFTAAFRKATGTTPARFRRHRD